MLVPPSIVPALNRTGGGGSVRIGADQCGLVRMAAGAGFPPNCNVHVLSSPIADRTGQQPAAGARTMDPSEVEFFGEKQLVTIVPNFSFDMIHLISGSVGPFRAGLPVKVPIWLAVNLKQQQKCRIIGQEWMEAEGLNEMKEQEKLSKLFTKMPSNHYIDEAQLLLSVASDDIPQADVIRTAVKDIWDIRMSKLRTSIDAFLKSDGFHAKLDHLTAMEINSVRPLLPHALDQMLRIQTEERVSQNTESTQ